MKEEIYNNRKLITFLGLTLIIIGGLIAYFNLGIEPEETIGGAFCGFGVGIFLISFSLKKPVK